jgi:predicted nucleic acid-binding protein
MQKNNLLVDANCFNSIFFPGSKEKRIIKKAIEKKFNIKNNIITLIEVSRNFRLKQSKRNYIHKNLINSGSLIVPDNNDWKKLLYIILEYKANNKSAGVNALRKMQMDCLLAAIAINKNCYLLTNDKDFKYLQSLEKAKELKLILYETLH